MAREAEDALNNGRHLLNQFFHGEGAKRFVFTLNCTDALNMAFKGVLNAGDHVVTTDLEHNSVSRPLRAMEKDGRITLTRLRADGDGYVSPDDVRRAIMPRTRLVALTHASNVLGTVQPVGEVGRIVREHDLLFLVDAAQTAGVVPIDVRQMNIDLLAFPGHKSLMGPTGTGALYVGPRAVLRAWREGGTGGDSSSETQPVEFPHFLEGGTPNVLGVAGLAAGVRWVQEQGIERIHAREMELIERLRRRLEEMAGVTVYGGGDAARRVSTLSFRAEAMPALELARSSTPSSASPSGPDCTAPRTSTAPSAPTSRTATRTGPSASAPGRSTPPKTWTPWPRRWRKSSADYLAAAAQTFHDFSMRSGVRPAASSACSVVCRATFSSGMKPLSSSPNLLAPGP